MCLETFVGDGVSGMIPLGTMRGNPLDPPLRSRFAALQLRELPSECGLPKG